MKEDGTSILQTKTSLELVGASHKERRVVQEQPRFNASSSAPRVKLMAAGSRIVTSILLALKTRFDPFDARGILMQTLHHRQADVPGRERPGARENANHIWHRDALDPAGGTRGLDPSMWMDGDEGLNFFSAAPPEQWIMLVAFSCVLFLVDMFLIQKLQSNFSTHLKVIGFWLAAAAVFNSWIWYSTQSSGAAVEWCTGYFLEWMLSMDNLFVFHLIFRKYKTPQAQVHKAVFVGILGALVMRMGFFMVLSTLLHLFHWMRIPFGALLVWSGISCAMGEEEADDVKELAVVQGLRTCFGNRLSDQYDEESRLFRWGADGRLQASLLVVVILCLEATDILFAVDSVSAKVAQIPNQYLAFSSSVVAMFGLRAMFFVVQDLVDMFHLLQYGLCLILVFIGMELMFSAYLHVSASTVCLLILCVFSTCIAGSWATAQKNQEAQPQAESDEIQVDKR